MNGERGVFADPEKLPVVENGVVLPAGAAEKETEASTAVSTFVQQVGAIIVRTVEDVERINGNIELAKQGIKFIDDLFSESRTAVEESKRKVEASRKALVTLIEKLQYPYMRYKEQGVLKIKEFLRAEEDRKTEIARAKEKERFEAAKKLEQAGDKAGAELIIDLGKGEIEDAKKPAVTLDQRTFGKKWKAEVLDIISLCGAVADRQIESFAVEGNIRWLNDFAKLNHDRVKVTGVRFFEE